MKFKILDEKGNELETITTNSNGEAMTSKYAVRDYPKLYLKEISTNEKYILNEEIIEIELKENQLTEKTVGNELKKGNLKIYKIDKDNKEIKIDGVRFDLYSEEKNKTIGVYTTDKNGEIYIENLPIGKYKLKEKSTNKWYNLNQEEKDIEVKWNETTEINVINEAKKGKIKVKKVDKENNEIKIGNVKFEVLDKEGNILETIITDSNGEAITREYALKDYEKLYLKEVATNDNYVLNDEVKEIELKANEVVEETIENEKIKGQIKIIKTSKDDNKITEEKAGTPLQGVEFSIFDINDNVIETVKTDKQGIALTSNLEKGEYKIKEISTNKYYYINEEIRNVEIEKDKQIVEVAITNESKDPDIDIEKNGPDRAEIGTEIQYDISVRNTGNTSLDNFTWYDVIPINYITVTKFKTGTYNQDLKYNLYYKTNMSNDEYILLMEDLNTKENYEIDFGVELADNEYVTEIRLEFGTVDIGFCSNENPNITATVNSNVKSEDTFTNTANVSGNFDEYEVTDTSKWKTLVYKILPKTGF